MKFHFCRTDYLNILAKSVQLERVLQEEPKTEISFSIHGIIDEKENLHLSDLVIAAMKAMKRASSSLMKAGVDPFCEPVEFEFQASLRGLSVDQADVILYIDKGGG